MPPLKGCWSMETSSDASEASPARMTLVWSMYALTARSTEDDKDMYAEVSWVVRQLLDFFSFSSHCCAARRVNDRTRHTASLVRTNSATSTVIFLSVRELSFAILTISVYNQAGCGGWCWKKVVCAD